MTRNRIPLLARFLSATVGLGAALAANAWAQGSLTPPGAPAPTMKSLDQIEARTPISAAPFVISKPGSYYLTTNLTVSTAGVDPITIQADNVTLDLNGFTISSTVSPATGYGIALSGAHANIYIFNGVILGGVTYSAGTFSGSGFAYGIAHPGAAGRNIKVSHVNVSGCLSGGIYLERNATLIESCIVDTMDIGLDASSIFDSTANNCGNFGILADWAYNCIGTSLIGGDGVYANDAFNCNGSSATGYGLYAYTLAVNCTGGTFTSGTGLYAGTANNCAGYTPGGNAGLQANVANNCNGTSNSSGDGVYAYQCANNCYGYTGTGRGVYAAKTVKGCYGYASSTGLGVRSDGIAADSYGESYTGPGMYVAYQAMNCTGIGATQGLNAGKMANNCYGRTKGGGASESDGLITHIAIGCMGEDAPNHIPGLVAYIGSSCDGSGSIPVSITYHYNEP